MNNFLISDDFIRVVTAHEAREFDRYTIQDLGIPSRLLMENAGAQVAQVVQKAMRARPTFKHARIVVVVGSGNNGADAIVACRHLLAADCQCQVFFVAEEEKWSDNLRYQVKLLKNATNKDSTLTILTSLVNFMNSDEDVIFIDGIFGAGLNRPPSGTALNSINFINGHKNKRRQNTLVVSIDIPSGLSMDSQLDYRPCIRADITVSFGWVKRAHISEPTKLYCGRTIAVNIGLFANAPARTFFYKQRRALLPLLLPASPTAHKGHFGHVLIFEGQKKYLGASRLCAKAALRVGAGLVTIACENDTTPTSLDISEFMHIARSKVDSAFMARIDAIVLGPGLSDEQFSQTQALRFLNDRCNDIPLVILDADGLRLLVNDSLAIRNTSIIATPHPKEAANLLGCRTIDVENNRFKAIEKLASSDFSRHRQIIWVLKGATTLIRSLQGEIFAFRGELPLLATGGSGDVLSGAIAGLVKQTSSPLAAALLGVSTQIAAAYQWTKKQTTRGALASEIADYFPIILFNKKI